MTVTIEKTTKRAYLQSYRDNNRDKYNTAHRRWRSSKYGPSATEGQRAACVKNPLASLQSNFGIVKPHFVLCMLCWNRVGELGHHRCVIDAGGIEKYAEKMGLPRKGPFWCESFSKRKARVSKRKCTPHVRRWWKENPDAFTGQARPKNWKSRPTGEVASDAKLIWAWLVDGRPIEKVASEYQMSVQAARHRLERILGFPIRRFSIVSRGEPVTADWVRRLVDRYAITKKDLAMALGRSRNFADNVTRQNQIPRAKAAWALVRFDRKMLQALLRSRNASQPALLRTLIHDLSDMYKVVLSGFLELRSQNGAAEERIKNSLEALCMKSRKETAKGDPFHWRAFLCWLPGVSVFAKRYDGPRNGWPVASKIATDFLAHEFECESWVVAYVLAGKVLPISRDALKLTAESALARAKTNGRFGEDDLTLRRKKLAAAYVMLGYSQKEMAPYVFSDAPASSLKNTWNFFQEHGPAIEVMARLNLQRHIAKQIVRNPKEFLAFTPE